MTGLNRVYLIGRLLAFEPPAPDGSIFRFHVSVPSAIRVEGTWVDVEERHTLSATDSVAAHLWQHARPGDSLAVACTLHPEGARVDCVLWLRRVNPPATGP